jgi:hypothetical protein
MSQSYVFDSNILIYHLGDSLTPAAKHRFATAIVQGSYVSIITRIEILGWQGHTPHSRNQAQELLSYFTEIPLNEAIANLCIRLRAAQRIKLPDAVEESIRGRSVSLRTS